VSRALALLPALLLAAFAVALGDFADAPAFPYSALAAAALLAFAQLGAAELDDSLRLGRWGRLWPLALLLVVAASRSAAIIPRAGAVALLLLPAFLLVPAALARCWRGAEARRLGQAGWSGGVLLVSLWALADATLRGSARAAEPLGRPDLLGVFLATTLPVAMTGLAATRWARWLALLATSAGGAALVLTRSTSAVVAAAMVGLVVSSRLGRARQLVAGLALLAIGLAVPRLEAIARERERAGVARAQHVEAARSGWRERPWLGWGPGAAPWTLAAFRTPEPGADAAGELLAEPPSVPLRLAYELGALGLAAGAGLVGAFAWRRWRERRQASAPRLHLAGAAGFAAAVGAGFGGSWLAVPALPFALAATAGVALAGGPAPEHRRSKRSARFGRAVVALYAFAAAVALAPFELARRDADRAARASAPAERDRLLREAVRRDAQFPLYAARLAWSGSTSPHERARGAVNAALAALGVGPLWLKAGALGLEANDPRLAVPALERAIALDPLAGAPPFLLFVASGGKRLDCAARGFLGEPKLAAATFFRGRERQRIRALALVANWPGIDAGWKSAFLLQATGALAAKAAESALVSKVDAAPSSSVSLQLFRRRPAPAELTRIAVDRDRAAKIKVPGAATLAGSARSAFPARSCSPAGDG
jgi:hypothetical protein